MRQSENKSNKLAFIVKDTKTYMNIEEARYRYAKKDDTCLLFAIVPKNIGNNLSSRLENTINETLWDEIIWIYSKSNSISANQKRKKKKNPFYRIFWDIRELFYNYSDRKKLDKIASQYQGCKLVISAHKNTQEHLAAELNPNELIMVDSGHRIFNRLNSDGFIDYTDSYTAHSRLKKYAFKLIDFQLFDRRRTTLFTVYADEITTNHKVDKNNFDYQNHLFQSKEVGDEVVWISTPIYSMAKGVRIEDYVSYINDYKVYLGIESKNLTYIPHPTKETTEEVDFIKNHLKCKVDDRDIPVEFKIAHAPFLPVKCISPFSSALVNLNLASKGRIKTLSAWHYEFKYFEIWKNWRRDVERNPELKIEFIDLPNCTPLFGINKSKNKLISYKSFKHWENQNY